MLLNYEPIVMVINYALFYINDVVTALCNINKKIIVISVLLGINPNQISKFPRLKKVLKQHVIHDHVIHDHHKALIKRE